MALKRLIDPRRWPAPIVFLAALVLTFLLSGAVVSLAIRLMGSQEACCSAVAFLWRWACYAGLIIGWTRLWKPRVVKRRIRGVGSVLDPACYLGSDSWMGWDEGRSGHGESDRRRNFKSSAGR